MVYKFCRNLAIVFLRLLYHLKILGIENLPAQGGFVLASNHVSFLDPIAIGAASYRKLNFMARESLFKNPAFAWLLRSVGSFPVVRNTADISALKSALARLHAGAGLLLFPEGTRGGGEIKKKPHPGVAFLAVKAGVPIIPVLVKGTDKALPRGSRFFKPSRISVTFGRPVFPDTGAEYETIVRDVIEKIRQLA